MLKQKEMLMQTDLLRQKQTRTDLQMLIGKQMEMSKHLVKLMQMQKLKETWMHY
jgi:hypothetical protein